MNQLEVLFGTWLKMVLPDAGIAERDARLTVIRQFAAEVTKGDILDLIFAFYSAATESVHTEKLRSAMRSVDTSFGGKDDAELAVIASGVLYELLDGEGDLAAIAALAVLCANFGALSDSNHIAEVVTKAGHCLGSEGVRIREESVRLPDLREILQSSIDEEGDPEAPEEEEEEGPRLLRVVAALSDYGDKVAKSVDSIEARRAEQSDILYWLISGRRQIGGTPLKGLRKEQVALLIAVEFANLTRQIPGPASTPAILSTLLDQCKNAAMVDVSLEVCIQSISATDGVTSLSKMKVYNPIVSPISFALVKAEETDWQDGWQSAFKTQTKKAANTKYPVLEIATQLYRETLLARAFGES